MAERSPRRWRGALPTRRGAASIAATKSGRVTHPSRRRWLAPSVLRRRSGMRTAGRAARSPRRYGRLSAAPIRGRTAPRTPSRAARYRRRDRSGAGAPIRRRNAKGKASPVVRGVRLCGRAGVAPIRRRSESGTMRTRLSSKPSVGVAPPKRRPGAVAMPSAHAGNRRRLMTTAVRLVRRRFGNGAAPAMAAPRGSAAFRAMPPGRRNRTSEPANTARRGHRRRAASGSRLRRRSGLNTPPGMVRWGPRSVRRPWSGILPR